MNPRGDIARPLSSKPSGTRYYTKNWRQTLASMQHMKWEKVTREERFFTGVLFTDMRIQSRPMLDLLIAKLGLPASTAIVDIGYEVCFFRDGAFGGFFVRYPRLEKQTLDLTVFLSNHRMLVIEAKAQQAFGTKQMDHLDLAKKRIEEGRLWSVQKVNLVALHSSRYKPSSETLNRFDASIVWGEIAKIYPRNRDVYLRADSLYGEKPRFVLGHG